MYDLRTLLAFCDPVKLCTFRKVYEFLLQLAAAYCATAGDAIFCDVTTNGDAAEAM